MAWSSTVLATSPAVCPLASSIGRAQRLRQMSARRVGGWGRCSSVRGGRLLGRRRRRRRQEDVLAVPAQLVDALADVLEGLVRLLLLGGRRAVGVPAADELLHRAHVDVAVV